MDRISGFGEVVCENFNREQISENPADGGSNPLGPISNFGV